MHPEAWKPIGFMNVAHYGTLLKENAISPFWPREWRPSRRFYLFLNGRRRRRRPFASRVEGC